MFAKADHFQSSQPSEVLNSGSCGFRLSALTKDRGTYMKFQISYLLNGILLFYANCGGDEIMQLFGEYFNPEDNIRAKAKLHLDEFQEPEKHIREDSAANSTREYGESDSIQFISGMTTSNLDDLGAGHIFSEIKVLLAGMSAFKRMHAKKSVNKAAHVLAVVSRMGFG
ncbi:unnamed protein product [Dovyalis caffra]|uniref:Uncharacterized protein n=1 Tax=Dovyalis caffra TaxID=77055 RepID=A0AAV1RES8_9ROSI|nr:unnamed protein product [Dovyalis caffra]